MAVFVNNPGNLRQPDAIPEIMRILDRFEHAALSVGSSSTQMWLNPYLPFVGLQVLNLFTYLLELCIGTKYILANRASLLNDII